MERRRSPEEVEISVEMTEGSRGICSAVAIWERRAKVEVGSSGVKRNLEHREARGSIILSLDNQKSRASEHWEFELYRVT
jgi:hypothetical protein